MTERRSRVDARRNRSAVLESAAALLRGGRRLSMQAVAQTAGVSRSTLYRHFSDPAALQRGLQEKAVADAAAAVRGATGDGRPPLAELRDVVEALVGAGGRAPLTTGLGRPPADVLDDVAAPLAPLAGRLAAAASLDPVPPAAWLRGGLGHFVETCLQAGWADAGEDTVERLLAAVAGTLDRGLVVLDGDGVVLSRNEHALDDLAPGARAEIADGGLYEDGSPAEPRAHPLTLALESRAGQRAVRARRAADGSLRWYDVDVRALRREPMAPPYGYVAVTTDVTDQKRFESAQLKPAGELGAAAAPLLDLLRVLDEVPPPLLPEQLVAEAMRLSGGPVALYVLDIDGSHLLRLAGSEHFPPRMEAPLALGPELAEDGLPDLAVRLATEMPGVGMAPMWLRGRAVGLLLFLRGSEAGLREVARLGAAALELAGGYTDVMDAARRRKDMNPAAEIQQSLLPPRIVRLASGELAGSVLPSYDVGGDWFDYVENRDGAWIAISDAAGKGPQAAGLGSVALAALRAARRNDATLEEAVETMDETVAKVGGPEFFATAIVGRWHSVYSVFSWINCGHPPPLLIDAGGKVEQLATRPDLPLGLERARGFQRHQRRLADGDRLLLYSDGISNRRTDDGRFGAEGIVRAALAVEGTSATATARAIQRAVWSASEDPLPDDAAVVVLRATAGAGRLQADDAS